MAPPLIRHIFVETHQPKYWNTSILILLWTTQAGFSLVTSVIAASFIPGKQFDERFNGEVSTVSRHSFNVTTFFTVLFTIFSAVFTVVQIKDFSTHRLYPRQYLAASVLMTGFFMLILGFASANLAFALKAGKWTKFEGSLLLDVVASALYIPSLIYASIVYTRFKKSEHLTRDCSYCGNITADTLGSSRSLWGRKTPAARIEVVEEVERGSDVRRVGTPPLPPPPLSVPGPVYIGAAMF